MPPAPKEWPRATRFVPREWRKADAIKARADALAENQDAVIGQQLAERWPEIVEAAAKPFGGIDQLIVLNGAKGLSETLASPQPGSDRSRSRPPAAGREEREAPERCRPNRD